MRVPFSLFKSELERKIRANDREYNLSFKYAVSVHVCLRRLWCLSFTGEGKHCLL